MNNQILIDGMNEEELIRLSRSKEIQDLIFADIPVVFKAGTSDILGQFRKTEDELLITLSQIIGGGEGILIKIMNLFRRFAKENNYQKITWKVHAVDCPKPNPKLKKILELKGFEIVIDEIDGQIYQKIEQLSANT